MIALTTYFFILQLILFVVLSIIAVKSNIIVKGNLLIMLSATLLATIPLHYIGPRIARLYSNEVKIDTMLEFFIFTILIFLLHLYLFFFLKQHLKLQFLLYN